MNREQYLLLCLAEECAEVAKIASKSMRFGLDNFNPNGNKKRNDTRLQEEIVDFLSVLKLLVEEKYLDHDFIEEIEIQEKCDKIDKYFNLSIELERASG